MNTILRNLAGALVAVAMTTHAGTAAAEGSDPEVLVEKARLTATQMLNNPDIPTLRKWVKKAKAVLIVPSLLKAGFVLGAEGGSGVLLARNAAGEWSYPAFYTLGSGSIGLQIGVQDSQVIFAIMSQKGLDAMLDRQVKLGADASVAAGPKGGGVEGATGIDLDADIYSFAMTRGLFGGLSFEGSVAVERQEWNQSYYGKTATARDIVIGRKLSNAGADALRRALAVD
jgi:lipid-binding SYLF domain-containing protein